ncbi:MAG TPA: tetratricopeptide repeat protein [Candidatus Hydrogenedentes bacterium]|nr:tetratricopeptide repeat protein [Candidatus Hydrogenedentota bacterium]
MSAFPEKEELAADGAAHGAGSPGAHRNTSFSLLILALMLLAAAAVRLAYLEQVRSAPDFAAPVLDPQLNDYWARALVTGDWTPPDGANDPMIRSTPYGRPPGYPWFLAGIYRVFGLHPLTPRLAQMALGLLTVLLAGGIGWKMYGPWGAGTAAGLLAFTWPMPFFEGELNSPALECFCFAVMIAGLLQSHNRYARGGLALAGLAGGWLIITRPNAALPVLLAAGWVAWRFRPKTVPQNRPVADFLSGFRPAFVFLAAALLCVLPVVVRNRIVGGEWTPVSYYGGVNLYIGNHPDSSGDRPRIPDIQEISGWEGWNCFDYPHLIQGLASRQGLDGSFGAASRWFARRALLNWLEHPGAMFRLTLRKALLFWGPATVSDSKEVALERQRSPILSLLPGFPLVAGLGLAGMVLVWIGNRTRLCPAALSPPPGESLLALLAMGHFLSVLPFFMAERYRVAALVPLALLAGGAVWRAREAIRFRHPRCAAWALVAVLAGTGFTHMPLAAYRPDEARWHFHRGLALMKTGNPLPAAVELQCAIARDPAHTWSWLYLAAAYEQMGRLEDALAACERAVKLSPGRPDAWNNLGWLYLCLNRPGPAETALSEAVRLDPEYRVAWMNLLRARLDQEKYREAETAARRLVEMEPNNPDAWNNLGWTLMLQRRNEEAEAAFLKALELDPGHPAARANLENLRTGTAQQNLSSEMRAHPLSTPKSQD